MGRKHNPSTTEEAEQTSDDHAKRLAIIRQHVLRGAGKVLPYGFQVLASAAAYTLGVTTTQLVGYCLRISTVTPVLGPALGLLGVGFASTLSGQAASHARKLCEKGGNPLKRSFWEPVVVEDAVLDAVLGSIIFKAMGGRFSSLMPSDLRYPGALAFESIPARSDEYARPGVKRELVRIFRRDGCHHCGSHKGPVIGDHMPPNKMVYGAGRARGKAAGGASKQWLTDHPVLVQMRQAFGFGSKAPRQRFYPQCQRCSIKQATSLRLGRRVLVLHLHAPPRHRPESLAGIFVGLRHNLTDGAAGSRPPRWNPLALTASLTSRNISGAAELGDEEEEQAGAGRRAALPMQPLQMHGHVRPAARGSDSADAVSASLADWGSRSPSHGGAGTSSSVRSRGDDGWGAERSAERSGRNKAPSPIDEAKTQAQAAFSRHFKQQGMHD